MSHRHHHQSVPPPFQMVNVDFHMKVKSVKKRAGNIAVALTLGAFLSEVFAGSPIDWKCCPYHTQEMVSFVDSRIWPEKVLSQFVILCWKASEKVAIHAPPFDDTTGIIIDIKLDFAVVHLNGDSYPDCKYISYNNLHYRWERGAIIKVIAGSDIGKKGFVVEIETNPPYISLCKQDTLATVSDFRWLMDIADVILLYSKRLC